MGTRIRCSAPAPRHVGYKAAQPGRSRCFGRAASAASFRGHGGTRSTGPPWHPPTGAQQRDA
eukprot:8059499-Alexandrium_andersonii.AAC.1